MSDLIIRFAAFTRVARHSAAEAVVSSAHRAYERFTREQTGQDMIEYAGVLLVVAIVVAAVVASPIGSTVSDAVTNLVNDITSGSCPKSGKC